MFIGLKKLCAFITILAIIPISTFATEIDYRLDENYNLIITNPSDYTVAAGQKVYIQVVNQGSDKNDLKDIDGLTAENYKQLINQSIVVTANSDGEFGYTYKLPETEGYYKIRANDGTGIVEKQFYFVTPARRQEIVNELKNRTLTPDIATLQTKMLSAYTEALDLELSTYNSVKNEIGVSSKIFTNVFNKIGTVSNADDLKKMFYGEVLVQNINLAEPSALKTILSNEKNIELIGFDFINSVSYGTMSNDGETSFYQKVAAEPFENCEYMVSKIKEILLLTAIEKATSWEDINPVIEENKSIIVFNYDRYNTHANRNNIDLALVGNQYTLATLGDAIDSLPASGGVGGGSGTGGGGGGGVSTGGGAGIPIPDTSQAQESIMSDAENETVKVFEDISSHWAREYIEKLQKLGIVNGISDNKFAPDDNVKREEFIKMLVTLFKIEISEDDSFKFEDVSKGHWSYPYAVTARKYGIVQGYDGNKFGLEQDITREDMLVLLHRACEKLDLEMFSVSDEISFSDDSLISDYAVEAVRALAKNGVISGYEDGTFRAKNSATRGETAKILYSFIDYVD